MATQDMVKKAAQGTQIVTIEDYLKKNEHLIVRALQNTISPERFLAVTNIVMQSPALMGCSQASLVAAVLQTVQIGLTPGAISHVYYVPFVNKGVKEVQMIVGYKGLVELVNRSKDATILTAECVYEKDQFQYEKGLNPTLRHIPASGDRGAFVGVYAIAKNMLANEKVFEFLSKEEVEKVRSASKAGASDYSPWNKWFDEMAKKTAVKRLCKLLPISVEVQQSISADETVKVNIAPKMVDVPDKTEWTDAVVVPQPKPEPAQEATKSPEPTPEPTKQEEAVKTPPTPESDSIMGVYKSRKIRPVKGRDGKAKDMTDWTVDVNGDILIISQFGGHDEYPADTVLIFSGIKTSEWQGKTQYLAGKVQTTEEVWNE
jgi:recombination protein RecT